MVYYKLKNKHVYIHTAFIKGSKDWKKVIDELRNEFSDAIIQVIYSDTIYNYKHIIEILAVSFLAEKRNIMCANKIEVDFLMRLLGTNQIMQAINEGGLRNNHHNTIIVITNKKLLCDRIKDILVEIFGLSEENILNDRNETLKKLEVIKKKYNNSFLDEINIIEYLREIATLVTN